MSSTRHPPGGLPGLILSGTPPRPKNPPSPLRLIPADAELVVQTRGPRQLVEAVTTLDYIKDVLALDAYKELLDATQTRRFFQMVAYFERELGVSWPELLDRIGGAATALPTKPAQ